MTYLEQLNEDHKARLRRIHAAAKPIIPPENKPVKKARLSIDEQVIAGLRAQVEQLKAALVIKNQSCPQSEPNHVDDLPPEPEPLPGITIDMIKRVVTAHYGLSLIAIESQRRQHNISLPRQIAMYLATRLTLRSLPFIGKHFGNKDHTTVLHARETITKRRKVDAGLDAELIEFERKLTGQ